MAVSEEAQRNHDELFPNHRSTLKVTDPELVEIFDNWAFGEVPKNGALDTRTRLIVQLAALAACPLRIEQPDAVRWLFAHGSLMRGSEGNSQ